MNQPDTYAQQTNVLLRPLKLAEIEKLFAGVADLLLTVRISIPAADPSDSLTKIGWLSLTNDVRSAHHRSCQLGITISSEYQGEGYGTETINWALDWAFRVAGMHCV